MEFHGKRWTNALGLEKIAGKQIRRLEIIDAAVDDDFLETVANLPIESLELSASQMPEVEVKQLKKPRRLQIMVHDI